jgi:transposase
MNKNKTDDLSEVSKNLKELQDLIKHLIAVQLYIGGATQDEICENLSISKTTVNGMVKGIKKEAKPKAKKEKGKRRKSEATKQLENEGEQQITNES